MELLYQLSYNGILLTMIFDEPATYSGTDQVYLAAFFGVSSLWLAKFALRAVDLFFTINAPDFEIEFLG